MAGDAVAADAGDLLRPIGGFRPLEAEDCERSILELFRRRVAREPDRLAVVAGGRQVSYRELDALTRRVAGALVAQGATPQSPIAFLLDPGIEAVATALGIIEMGGVALGLDPWAPAARSAAILEEAGAEALVTRAPHLESARRLGGARRVVDLEALESAPPGECPTAPPSAGALTYLLYTSGSTGPPKGVMHTHRTIIRCARGYANGFRVSAEDRVGCTATLSVAQGVIAAFCSLLTGATFCPFDLRGGGLAGLAAWLAREEITFFIVAASVFRQLEQALAAVGALPRLRLLKLGSEQVRASDVALYRRLFGPSCVFANALGCSETFGITQYAVARDTVLVGDVVPIGFPEDGMAVLLLDDDGAEVAPGAIGEIAVKSRFVSPGYWRRPEQSAAAFAEAGDGERIYRTGDLGRRRPDGCIEHHGRKGFRVKLHGVRVELEEVEAALGSHARVRAAAAAVRAEGDDNRLIGYVVAAAPAPTAGELRRHLATTLPDAAIPSTFVFLDAMPLMPSGKIDRHALVAATGRRPPLETAFVSPRTPFEHVIAEVWREILRVDRVGALDDFFDLGGTSLCAMRATARVGERLGLEVAAQLLFDRPTVESLAEALVVVGAERAGPARLSD